MVKKYSQEKKYLIFFLRTFYQILILEILIEVRMRYIFLHDKKKFLVSSKKRRWQM